MKSVYPLIRPMKRLIFHIIIFLHLISCSSVNTVDEPDPDLTPGQTETEIMIRLGMLPDSVQFGQNASFSLKVTQNTAVDLFYLSIDTVGHFKLEIDDKDFSKVTTLLPDLNYTLKFTPLKEGYAGLKFNITNEKNDSAHKAVEIHTFSPQTFLEFSDIPDSIAVNQPLEFRFTVKGITGEEYTLTIDTVVPEFRMPLQNPVSGQNEIIRRGAELKINGRSFKDSIKILAGYPNVFRFSNPKAIGDYHLLFTCTDKQGKETHATRTFHAYSPEEIVIQFYNTDPLNDLQIEKERFYEELNRNFSHDPLSDVFQGKETDSVSWHIYPSEAYIWSVIGKGVTFHIGQKGNDEFYFPANTLSFEGTKATLKPEINGQNTEQTLQSSGFHGLLFFYMQGRPYEATTTYRLTVFDPWGKKTSADFTVHTY